MRKSYKALRIMEAHKTAEPKFARSMKFIYPHLDKLRGLGGYDQDSIDEEDNNTSISLRENNLMLAEQQILFGSDSIDRDRRLTDISKNAAADTSRISSQNFEKEIAAIDEADSQPLRYATQTQNTGLDLTAAKKDGTRNDYLADFKTETDSRGKQQQSTAV